MLVCAVVCCISLVDVCLCFLYVVSHIVMAARSCDLQTFCFADICIVSLEWDLKRYFIQKCAYS